MKNIITKIKDKIDSRKPINIFGISRFLTMEERTSNSDRFEDMVDLYSANKYSIAEDSRFIKTVNILDRMRETFYFKDFLTDTHFGPMLGIDYIDITKDHGSYVYKAVDMVIHELQSLIFSVGYHHEEDRDTWVTFGYELRYENNYTHAVLVIPFKDESGYTKVCHLIIPCKNVLH